MVKRLLGIFVCALIWHTGLIAGTTRVAIKYPGKKSVEFLLPPGTDRCEGMPVSVKRNISGTADTRCITFTIAADEDCWINFSDTIETGMSTSDCEFYMPGFWYHKNLRSPKGAPSFHTSDSWSVREDRLSVPLCGVYDAKSKKGMSVLRLPDCRRAYDCVPQNLSGEVILPDSTSIGSVGFANSAGTAKLVIGFPYSETPRRYIRKLTLIDPITAFQKMEKGDTLTICWELRSSANDDYTAFVSDTWNHSYDTFRPAPVNDVPDTETAMRYMVPYFKGSFVDKYDLKFHSGMRMRTDDCLNTDNFQIGFVGRVLLNAFNAYEFGEKNGDAELLRQGEEIFGSVLKHGFSPEGYFRENVKLSKNEESDVLSIRRQSEGVFAILSWLNYEKEMGRTHKGWEDRMKVLLANFAKLQNPDGSYPRKFRADGSHVDSSGGSTPSATLPLTMAYDYFGDGKYLDCARKTGEYLEKNLISKGDYFSSTLDANCEDKEASLYAATAMFYLSQVTSGRERLHYLDLCRDASYFCLSWYYMWDVPFAKGQMLGDVGFKSRGWGNVSVENNHIDVFIFDFATVLDKLADHFGEPRFSNFAQVIRTSMLQLMPTEDNMYDIAKAGYYPEVVQHTTWDYGKNGKGFYNDIFAPGWTVASLWQMLSPERIDNCFKRNNIPILSTNAL